MTAGWTQLICNDSYTSNKKMDHKQQQMLLKMLQQMQQSKKWKTSLSTSGSSSHCTDKIIFAANMQQYESNKFLIMTFPSIYSKRLFQRLSHVKKYDNQPWRDKDNKWSNAVERGAKWVNNQILEGVSEEQNSTNKN